MLKLKSRAIETEYQGYRFRSRTEAFYAVFLDAWQFIALELVFPADSSRGRYLPDFWLTDWEAWLEIKGPKPTEEEIKKCEELANETDRAVILCFGRPGVNLPCVYCCDSKDSGSGGIGESKLTIYTSDCPSAPSSHRAALAHARWVADLVVVVNGVLGKGKRK